MDFITGRHLPRRTFLRGAGAAIAAAVDNAIGGNGAINQIPISPTRLFSIIEKLESGRAA